MVIEKKKNLYEKILNIIIAICASFALINYIIYCIRIVIFSDQRIAFIIVPLVLCCILVPFILRKKIKNITGKFYTVFKTVYALGALFYFVTFFLMCATIYSNTVSEIPAKNLPEKTVYLVFGSKVSGTSEEDSYPNRSLAKRLDLAYDLMEKTPASYCIVSGGKGNNEPCTEASAMKKYLVEKGIAEDRIIIEDRSRDTIENIDFSKEIIAEKFSDYSVVAVSTNYHIVRIKMLAEKMGIDFYAYYNASTPSFINLYVGMIREYMSYVKLLVFSRV